MNQPKHPAPCGEDIILWPDATWCYRENLEEYLTFMSDDFEVLPFESDRWNAFDKD